MLKRIRKAPFFPIVPFVPMAIMGGLIALEAIMLVRMRKLARSVDELLGARAPQQA
ncbi:MAG TPA: hypothetical protein VFF06_31730 [Polyangia bacterium]|nr:hypothetical protein [Polyangia bacterium]